MEEWLRDYWYGLQRFRLADDDDLRELTDGDRLQLMEAAQRELRTAWDKIERELRRRYPDTERFTAADVARHYGITLVAASGGGEGA